MEEMQIRNIIIRHDIAYLSYIILFSLDHFLSKQNKSFVIIKSLNIRETDGVFLIIDHLDEVQCIEIDRIIKGVYNLDINLSVEEVAEEYIRIKEEEKIQAQNSVNTLEEIGDKIAILESENQALKEEISQIQVSLASLVSAIEK